MAKGKLSIHTQNIFPIIKKWLYSEHDIFFRELISNSVDAITKRQKIDKNAKDDKPGIEVIVDKKAKTVQIVDNGIGMDEQEIKKYINQIAFSGAEDFVEKYKDKDLIGHFGLGFYSSFMVAKKVTIDSLSWKEGSIPSLWECEGETDYKIFKGKRDKIGTTVTVYLNNDSKDYTENYKISEILEKYCCFMDYPITFDKKIINQKEPLWEKDPKKIKDQEYKDFYKEYFNDWEEPLFWIHLNVDYPFNLKGILYFPKLKLNSMGNMGMVKLFCNRVFVADNVKELLPEFLLLLKGGIDIPDIPLNVSRSFLQHDTQVQKITKYIIKKISDELKKMFKNDRKKFETIWKDIDKYIKYGVITQDSFFKSFKENLLFESADGSFLTLQECTAGQEKEQKIYYTSDKSSAYIKVFQNDGYTVILADEVLDTHLYQKFEMDNPKLKFARIDAQVSDAMIDKKGTEDKDGEKSSENIKKLFEDTLKDKKVQIEIKPLNLQDIPAMVVFDEAMRRFMEMSATMGKEKMPMDTYKLVVNSNNSTIKKIVALSNQKEDDKVLLLCKYVQNLALIRQNSFTGEKLQEFAKMSSKVLELI